MRKLTVVVATILVLTLAGCAPAALQGGGLGNALRDLPGVDDVSVESSEGSLDQRSSIRANVTLSPDATPGEVGDVVDAWRGATPDRVLSTLTVRYPGEDTGRATLRDHDETSTAALRDAVVQWSTLAAVYPQASLDFSYAAAGTLSITLPEADSPGAVRAAVDELASAIAGAETPASWSIVSAAETDAPQRLDWNSYEGLPTDQQLQHLETLDAPFASAGTIGAVHLTVDFAREGTQVNADLSPTEFYNTPSDQIVGLIPASSVWPALEYFIDRATPGQVSTLTLSVFGATVAHVETGSCARPTEETYPLDFEAWDYWASSAGACAP